MGEWLLLQQGFILYAILFALLLGGAIGFPIPEDIPLIFAGVLLEMGRVRLDLVAGVCYAGVLAGDIIIFAMGWKFGPGLFQKQWFKSRFSSSRIRRIRYNLEKRSIVMILIARHLFYFRTLTFLICGAVRMNVIRFLIADAIAALVSLPIMLTIGYLASAHINYVLEIISRTKFIVGIILLAIIVTLLWRNRKKLRAWCWTHCHTDK